jgi:hypothetical protein
VREVAASIPPAARHALISAYQVGFTTTFNHLMSIAMWTALIGAVAALALVRQRDFVPSYATAPDTPPADTVPAPSPAPAPAPAPAPVAPAAVPAVELPSPEFPPTAATR